MLPAKPTFKVKSDSTFCKGDSATLSFKKTYTTYKWSTGSTAATITVSKAGNYWCTVANGGCSINSDTVAIIVNPLPKTGVTVNGSTNICKGQSTILNELACNNCTYQWYQDAKKLGLGTSSSYTATKAATYYCAVTTKLGCSANSNSVVITANCKSEDNLGENINTIDLYPNPANSELNIQANMSAAGNNSCTIEIRNLLGQEITFSNAAFSNGQLQLTMPFPDNMKSGLYFVLLKMNHDVITKKFTVVRN